MTTRATGSFDVDLIQRWTDDDGSGTTLGRRSIDKRFRGDLDATSVGEMLSAMTPVRGSAGYVAIERVTGTLGERRGSFVLQHFGVMNRGASSLALTVVPDSGTGELAGLTGSMKIIVENGKHSYEFDYELTPG